ncbi:MAG: molybdopterin adenylyltransferase [Cytophagaceae bacterium]|jgi:molybdopterin adenylyltransferase|nr:molybdopterin adenylyltransferase [Cytophagaceae bacterium]
MEHIRIGILTSSDRASAGVYEDKSGPAIEAFLKERIKNPLEFCYLLVPDELSLIQQGLEHLCDKEGCSLVVTTGGTGPALRDVTVEATELVCQKMLPGFGEKMRAVSLQYVPTAILSRQTAGIRNQSLLINLPGKPKSIHECLEAVFSSIPYCLDLIGAPYIQSDDPSVFRPKT